MQTRALRTKCCSLKTSCTLVNKNQMLSRTVPVFQSFNVYCFLSPFKLFMVPFAVGLQPWGPFALAEEVSNRARSSQVTSTTDRQSFPHFMGFCSMFMDFFFLFCFI